MSLLSLTTSQIEALEDLRSRHQDAEQLDIDETDHASVIVTLWGPERPELAPIADYPLCGRYSVSVAGTIRDLTAAAA